MLSYFQTRSAVVHSTALDSWGSVRLTSRRTATRTTQHRSTSTLVSLPASIDQKKRVSGQWSAFVMRGQGVWHIFVSEAGSCVWTYNCWAICPVYSLPKTRTSPQPLYEQVSLHKTLSHPRECNCAIMYIVEVANVVSDKAMQWYYKMIFVLFDCMTVLTWCSSDVCQSPLVQLFCSFSCFSFFSIPCFPFQSFRPSAVTCLPDLLQIFLPFSLPLFMSSKSFSFQHVFHFSESNGSFITITILQFQLFFSFCLIRFPKLFCFSVCLIRCLFLSVFCCLIPCLFLVLSLLLFVCCFSFLFVLSSFWFSIFFWSACMPACLSVYCVFVHQRMDKKMHEWIDGLIGGSTL